MFFVGAKARSQLSPEDLATIDLTIKKAVALI
jgi:hypothetical protein